MDSSIIVFDTGNFSYNSTTIRTRNTILISKELNVRLVTSVDELLTIRPSDVKKFIVVGASFNPRAAEVGNFLYKNKNIEIIVIHNDYMWTMPGTYSSKYKTHKVTIISNMREKSNKIKNYHSYYFVNLNSLIAREPNEIIHKKYDVIYYGMWRKRRHKYLQKYLRNNDIYLSSSKKNLRKFKQLGAYQAIYSDKLNWEPGKETLNLFRYSLYLEDDYTHDNYNCLANRFYESLFCNTVLLFDKSCKNTINEANIEFDNNFYINDYEELDKVVKSTNFVDLLEKQQRMWIDYSLYEKQKTIETLKEIILA